MTASIDSIVRSAAESFAAEVRATGWYGRENEAVNLFTFRHLLRECQTGSVLYDPAQIGIEVAVPQLPGAHRKAQVRKDLVIWSKPAMTCWNERREPTVRPMSIIEWKVRRREMSGQDLDWLVEFSRHDRAFVGYAVLAWPRGAASVIRCARISNGIVEPKWLET